MNGRFEVHVCDPPLPERAGDVWRCGCGRRWQCVAVGTSALGLQWRAAPERLERMVVAPTAPGRAS